MKKANDFKYYYKKTGFFQLLFKTRKLIELVDIRNFEVLIPLFLTIAAYFLSENLYNGVDFYSVLESVKTVTIGIATAFISLLGLIISGLAITTGTISKKVAKNIEEVEKADALMEIMYSFYFISFFIGLTILMLLTFYFLTFTNLGIDLFTFRLLFLLAVYFVSFDIFYSISLIGTCLSVFLIYYKYSKED